MFPADLVGAARCGLPSRGDSEFRQDGNLVVTVWQDTRPVVILSTQHSPDSTTTVRIKKGDGSTISVTCPQAVVDYNQYMGDVDLGDQYRKYYQVRVKLRKSYKYIFWYCLKFVFITLLFCTVIVPLLVGSSVTLTIVYN